jgi:hypothetical protein
MKRKALSKFVERNSLRHFRLNIQEFHLNCIIFQSTIISEKSLIKGIHYRRWVGEAQRHNCRCLLLQQEREKAARANQSIIGRSREKEHLSSLLRIENTTLHLSAVYRVESLCISEESPAFRTTIQVPFSGSNSKHNKKPDYNRSSLDLLTVPENGSDMSKIPRAEP